MEQINEQWRPIVGYEGLYQVSNLGRVKSLERIDSIGRKRKEKILKPYGDGNGYLQVDLSKEGKINRFLVHRLVAQAFIPNPEGQPIINHKNEDKTLNVVFLKDDGSVDECQSNLEWCTYEYNNKYGTRIEREIQTKIKNGTYDPELCGLDRNERERLYRQKNKEKILEHQRKYRLKKKQSSEESLW